MKDPSFPTRLSDAAGDDALVREVLAAAKAEAMPTSRVATLLSTFEATKFASVGPESAAGAASTRGWRWTLPLKLGTSLAIVCAIGLGWGLRESSAPTSAPRQASEVAQRDEPVSMPAPSAEAPAAARVEDLPAALGSVEPAPGEHAVKEATRSGARAPRVASPKNAGSTTTTTAAATFHEELAVVEAARSALARGDSDSCLRALDRYDERFRGGVFADEVVVMRIEALVARGEHERARKLGSAFLAKKPGSTYASRIRSITSSTP